MSGAGRDMPREKEKTEKIKKNAQKLKNLSSIRLIFPQKSDTIKKECGFFAERGFGSE